MMSGKQQVVGMIIPINRIRMAVVMMSILIAKEHA